MKLSVFEVDMIVYMALQNYNPKFEMKPESIAI